MGWGGFVSDFTPEKGTGELPHPAPAGAKRHIEEIKVKNVKKKYKKIQGPVADLIKGSECLNWRETGPEGSGLGEPQVPCTIHKPQDLCEQHDS